MEDEDERAAFYHSVQDPSADDSVSQSNFLKELLTVVLYSDILV